jgi:DNA-binding CsgD family transcriptional regulator
MSVGLVKGRLRQWRKVRRVHVDPSKSADGLQMLGLSAAEQRLYELLLTRSAFTLAEAGELSPDAGALVGRLERRGLVARLPGEPRSYTVAPADEALADLIAERGRELAAARSRLTELTARFRQAAVGDPAALVEVCHGAAAAVEWYERLHAGTKREFRAFDGPPYVRPNDWESSDHVELKHIARGIQFRVLYDRRAVIEPGRIRDLERSAAVGEIFRVGDIPMKLFLTDEPLAMLPLRSPDDLSAWLIVRGSALYDALSAMFEAYWEQALPLRLWADQERTPAVGAPTATERALLTLLTAGHTEDTIAEHLGWHRQTVHRHLNALMGRLDSVSRFQAGYQAVRRGWLQPEPGSADA